VARPNFAKPLLMENQSLHIMLEFKPTMIKEIKMQLYRIPFAQFKVQYFVHEENYVAYTWHMDPIETRSKQEVLTNSSNNSKIQIDFKGTKYADKEFNRILIKLANPHFSEIHLQQMSVA
jgi:hypothetical protein